MSSFSFNFLHTHQHVCMCACHCVNPHSIFPPILASSSTNRSPRSCWRKDGLWTWPSVRVEWRPLVCILETNTVLRLFRFYRKFQNDKLTLARCSSLRHTLTLTQTQTHTHPHTLFPSYSQLCITCNKNVLSIKSHPKKTKTVDQRTLEIRSYILAIILNPETLTDAIQP